jgi:hypothetical protein
VTAQNDRDHGLHAHGADDARQRDHARLKRREIEAELQEQREQKRHRADTGAIDEAADDGGADGGDGKQGEVEDRRGRTPRMQHIGICGARAEHDEGEHGAGRQKIEAEQGAAEC